MFFPKSCNNEIIWKNIVEPDNFEMTIWSMRIACWIPHATNTHIEYVIIIVFFYNNCPNASQAGILSSPQ